MEEKNEKETDNKPKKKHFNIFDWFYRDAKDGNLDKPDDLKVLEKPGIKNFFKLLGRKLGKLMSANLIMIFGNFPIIFLLLATSGILSKSSIAPLYQSYVPLNAIYLFDQSPANASLLSIYGIQISVNVINMATKVFFVLGLLIIFTWGFTKVGTTYIYRNIINGDAVFPFSDFAFVAKRNVKQSLVFGILDAVLIVVFSYNLYFLFSNAAAGTMNLVMLFLTAVMSIVYFFMRPYMFIMVFMFDLKFGQIVKNSLYFVILGIKRNFAALGGVFLLVALNYAIFIIFAPIGIILPFVITLSIADFIGVYCAYPNILKYMVKEDEKIGT